MAGKTRSSLLSLAIIAVLIFGALSPTVVHADDGPPPSPPTEANNACTSDGTCPSNEGVAQATGDNPEAAAQATSEPVSAPTEVAAGATAEPVSAPTEVAAEATSTPDEAPTQIGSEGNTSSEEAAPPAIEEAIPASDSSILDQIPENTIVTVLDAQGQSQPLASQDTANAIATSDPIWCPQGQDPTPGANGCTNSFSSFDALLTFLSGNASYQGAGTIYIQQGAYNGGESSIDFNSSAYDLSNIKNFDLTITGGWNTSNNTLDPASTSNFIIPILIGTSTNPWGGSLFINNVTINKTDGTGLTLYSQNDITVVNVTVTNSVNGSGAEINAGRDVAINNSKFDRNKIAGAVIRAKGNVAVANSSFSNPVGGRRQNTGLDILSDGSVALFNILANENRQAGANINAGGRVTISNSFFSGTKSIKGSGASETFLGYGLQVITPDAIDLSGVTANDNFLWGASLQAGGDVAIADSVFNANTTESPGFIDDTGLLITSGGSVALNNVQADDNRLIGATIHAAGDVAISNSSFSSNNGVILSSGNTPTFYGYGLQVVTQGNIALNLVTASNNTLFGAHLEAGGDTTVVDSTFSNQTSGSTTDQTGRGLEIIGAGNVFLSNVVIDNNQMFGADIQAGGNIFLDSVTATNNGLDGIDALGKCTTVSLNNGTFSGNGGYGLSIVNAQLNQTGSPVFANNGAGDIAQDPGTCVFPIGGTPPGGGTGSGGGTGTGSPSNPPQAASQNHSVHVISQPVSFAAGKDGSSLAVLNSKGPSLQSFLASHNKENSHLGLFAGKYAYIYSNSVLHIIVFMPVTNDLAMSKP